MDRGKILAIIIAILVIAVVVGTIIYLVNIFRQRQTVVEGIPGTVVIQTSSPTPTGQTQGVTVATQIYQGPGFNLQYPQSWGVLTCSDSQNFELDPSNNADSQIDCDFALKPVTVLVNPGLPCQGEQISIGSHQVTRLKVNVQNGLNYRWCLNVTGTNLDISHRVSATLSRATSNQDYSQQVEQMIATIGVVSK